MSLKTLVTEVVAAINRPMVEKLSVIGGLSQQKQVNYG
jgi:hypothetical protein